MLRATILKAIVILNLSGVSALSQKLDEARRLPKRRKRPLQTRPFDPTS